VDHRRSALFVVLVVALCVVTSRPAAAATDPRQKDQAGLAEIKAPDAWARGRGSGVSVAIVSTGIASHPDLQGKVDGGFDATGTDPRRDTGGRGTHLAGIVGAATDNGIGIAAVAPLARLLPFKAFDTTSDDESWLIRALNETRAAKPAVVLVDVPAGYEGKDLLRQTLKGLGDAGTSVVVGAQGGLPLDDLPVLAVADKSGSSTVGARGVAAPGQNILSTTVTSSVLGRPTYDYGPLSGTGQAAAHVAGAVAILRGLGANAGQAADLLRSTARRSGGTSQGAGVIDVAAAAAAYQTPAPSPTTSTTKAAVRPAVGKQVKPPGGTIPPGQVVPLTPSPTLLGGDSAEPGVGEEPVVPPGAEEFADGPGEDSGGGGRLIGGRERPWGTLTIGFGLLFGIGGGLSLTFRRLADVPI